MGGLKKKKENMKIFSNFYHIIKLELLQVCITSSAAS